MGGWEEPFLTAKLFVVTVVRRKQIRGLHSSYQRSRTMGLSKPQRAPESYHLESDSANDATVVDLRV